MNSSSWCILYSEYDIAQLRNQLSKEGVRAIFASLYLTEVLFPIACCLTALQQRLMNQAYQFNALRSGNKRLACALGIASGNDFLDDGCSGRRSADTVLLHGFTESLILSITASGFHRLEKRGVGVWLRRSGLLLLHRRDVRTVLALYKGR